jgi:Rieske Fe-S protein
MAGRDDQARRSFLKAVTGAVATVIGSLGSLAGLGFLAHPLRRRTVTGGEEPIRVAAPDDLRPGKPLRVNVVGERRDGWLRMPKVRLGSAWLLKTPEGRVRAFSTICPHLGCGVDWNEKTEKFDCPCHQSSFDTEGRCLYGPSPRGLDELEVVATAAEVRVRYQRFKVGSKEREPIG